MMEREQDIDWNAHALDFLVKLSPIKKIREQAQLIREVFSLVEEYMLADAVCFYRNFDELTTRVVLASKKQVFHSHLNPDSVQNYIRSDEYQSVEKIFQPLFFINEQYEKCIVIPLYNTALSGGLIMGWKALKTDEAGFDRFLTGVQMGMNEMMQRMSVYHEIDELTTRFNAILETIPEGIVYVDDSGKSAWVNTVGSELLKLNQGSNQPFLVATAMQELRSGAVNQEEINEIANKLFSEPNQTIKDWKWIIGDPILSVLRVACKPISSPLVNGRLWVFTDITFSHIANEQLKELNEELAIKRNLADEQNQAKSEFLANMSHEIRTPMNGVIGMTSLLMHTILTEEQKEYVDTIRLSGETLLSLINDILDLSKIESGKLEIEEAPMSLVKLVEETYDLLSVRANEKGLDLLYLIDPNVPSEVLGDPTRLRQILLNLVSNGIKFTSKGDILIHVQSIGKQEDVYHIQISVKDTGIGIPANKFNTIFESFSQVDTSTTRKYGGTGLGLSICQRLVNMMGGTISVSSTEGLGSTFTFNIKVHANREVKQFDFAPVVKDTLLTGKKILILDDNETNLQILQSQCKLWGMNPVIFNDCHLAIAEMGQQEFDLAIVDMLMEEYDGVAVAREMKMKFPDKKIPIILFSSLGFSHFKNKEDKDLFAAILVKPTKHSMLKKTMMDILGRKEGSEMATMSASVLLSQTQSIDNIRILVAEDNDTNQKLIRKTLEKLGYGCELVNNGVEAVEAAKRKQYDLILMDVMMPEMDGYEATQQIIVGAKAHKPIIIAMTANALADDKNKAMRAGMDDYISKPFRIADIEEKINKWKPHFQN
ncbi:MAG: response regulator [Bacteroidota bacterium]